MRVSFDITAKVKGLFFDRALVQRAVDRGVRASLNRAGAYVRRAARNSIRPAPRGVSSAPGRPPRDHLNYAVRRENRRRRRAGLPRLASSGGFQGIRHILYAFTPPYGVIVGPISNKGGRATHTLEFGGFVTLRGADGRRRIVRIAARPYMRPALEAAAKYGVLQQFRDCVSRAG